MLLNGYNNDLIEAGCDEAGRGCIAGPVFAAAVILPPDFSHPELNDSKQLSKKVRESLRTIIEEEAIAWAVARVEAQEIDEINILNASIKAMHLAVDKLKVKPEFLLIDGNRFKPYKDIPHLCFVKGDGRFLPIAAASVLAKTHRDEYMLKAGETWPQYNWKNNKGYPTLQHKMAIQEFGISPLHRRSFNYNLQLKISFG
ncbi:MAG: ribonuclease HII [Chlorobi bacterium]|nr:ribonuclease HII [Chlorobiota bacterium]